MDNLLTTVIQNIKVVAILAHHPTHTLRVLSENCALVPILTHEDRLFQSIQRFLSKDGRERVCSAIDITIKYIEDFIAIGPVNDMLRRFIHQLISIQTFIEGVSAIKRLYENDVIVALAVDLYLSRWHRITTIVHSDRFVTPSHLQLGLQ